MYNQDAKCNVDSYHQSLKSGGLSSTPISIIPPTQSCAEAAQDSAVAFLFFVSTLELSNFKKKQMPWKYSKDDFFFFI